MKSNRIRFNFAVSEANDRFRTKLSPITSFEAGKLFWQQLPAPLSVPQIGPDEIIRDILEATLLRVQKSSSPDIAAAAVKCLNLLRGKDPAEETEESL
jgi:hypothetical protein